MTTTARDSGLRRKTVEALGTGGHRDITTVYVYDAMGELAAEYESVTVYNQAGTPSPGTNPLSGVTNPCGALTCYVSVDQLGSTRMVTDSTGAVKRRYDYLPFGEELGIGTGGRTAGMGYQASGDGFNPKFTGQVRGLESRLDYFNARYYSPEQGRFVSPDPENAGANPTAPQTWNGYAYAGNNPVNVVDPSGLGFFDFLGNLVHNVLVAASGGLWGVLTSAMEGHAPAPSFAGLPGADSLLSCGGPFGNCGGIGGGWTEETPVAPVVRDPERFIFDVNPNSIEGHHVFVQQLRAWFAEQGINIDEFKIWIPASVHRLREFGGLHTGKLNWNAYWRTYRAEHPHATADEMMRYGKELVKKFRIGGFPGGGVFMDIPLVFVDTCKMNPKQVICYYFSTPGEVY